MSWRLVTKHLHNAGPQTTSALALQLNTDWRTLDRWLRDARNLGAVESTRIGHQRISLMGRAMIEGRVELVQRRPGGYSWRATWMQPLPVYAEAAA